jgi:hypothetical protein
MMEVGLTSVDYLGGHLRRATARLSSGHDDVDLSGRSLTDPATAEALRRLAEIR